MPERVAVITDTHANNARAGGGARADRDAGAVAAEMRAAGLPAEFADRLRVAA